jgi:hypothetical protein
MTVRKPLRYIGFTAIMSVLLVELVLSDIPAPSHFLYKLGQVYLKLCYSYVSAFIFYLLAVHWHKETRRVRTFRLLNNAVYRISGRLSNDLLSGLYGRILTPEERENLALADLELVCNTITPQSPGPALIFAMYLPYCQNYGQFIQLMCIRFKSEVNDLLPLSENIDAKVLESLANILAVLSDDLNPATHAMHNPNLGHASHGLYELNNEMIKLRKRFDASHKKYAPEYHYAFRSELTEQPRI